MSGLKPEDFIGKHIGDVADNTGEQKAQLRGHVERAFAGEVVTFFRVHDFPAGRTHLEVRVIPESDATGTVQSVIIIWRDITFKARQESLIASGKKILEMMALWETDLPGVLHQLCLEVERLIPGRKLAILLAEEGGRFLKFVAAPDVDFEVAGLIERLEVGPRGSPSGVAAFTRVPVFAQDFETDPQWENFRPAARKLGLGSSWACPFFSRSGELLGVMVSYGKSTLLPSKLDRDLLEGCLALAGIAVEQDRARRSVRAIQESLEARIADSTTQLRHEIEERKEMEKWLVAARQAALDGAKAKTSFVANISHEIRTPIHAITGMLYALTETELTETQKKYVATIQRASDSLITLLSDILDFSKAESGKLNLYFRDFDFVELVQHTVEPLSMEIEKKGVRFKLEMGPGLAKRYRSDSARIRQILSNILGNAFKFTAAGEIRVRVSVAGSTGSRELVRFEVSDTGIGIAEESRERVFEEFTQVESNAARKYGGAGLGLSICRRLVALLEGNIGFESEPGKGSVFWFVVPMESASESVAPLAGPAAPPVATAAPLRGRILLVEDNPVNQEVTTTLLRSFGHEVEIASGGAEAISKFGAGAFDLVLMDCQMPEMDGYQTTKALRGLERAGGARVPILAMTADVSQDAAARCFKSGMNDCLFKPVAVESMKEKIQLWLLSKIPAAHPEEPVVDLEAVEKLRGFRTAGKPNLFVKLVEIYLEDSPPRVARLNEAVRSGDSKTYEAQSHYVKSASATLGAVRLARICQQMENLGKGFDSVTAGTLFDVFEREYQRVVAELRKLADPPPPD